MANQQEEKSVPWNTPVPADLSDAALGQMHARGFNSKSEYIRHLIRADVEKAALDKLEAKLLGALERGDFTADSPELWEKLRSQVAQRK